MTYETLDRIETALVYGLTALGALGAGWLVISAAILVFG